MQIYILDISPLFEEAVIHRFYETATEIRRHKADELKQPEDKARCIGAGVLLQKAYELYRNNNRELAFANSLDACGEMSLPNECMAENGKPCFEGAGQTQPYFNLSHSGNYAICAMSMSYEMGLDIQKKRKKMDAVVNRVFSLEEQNWLETVERLDLAAIEVTNGNEKSRFEYKQVDCLFTEIWTQKEARAKLGGEGLKMLLIDRDKENETEIETHWLDSEYVWSLAWQAQNSGKGGDRSKADRNKADGQSVISRIMILDKNEVFSC